MPLQHIHSYLVHPGKKAGHVSKVGGTTVPLSGKMFDLLNDIYEKSDLQCDIATSFNHDPNGSQKNECRDLILHYLETPNLPRGRKIAERLEKVTTGRSGLGLLFVLAGKEGSETKVVISRFPTDIAILAEETDQELNVQFLERVFMKSATSYKAAVYRDSSLKAGFWKGRAVDRQINDRVVQTAAYWINDFLASDLEVTAAAGTRTFAIALRNAARTTSDVAVKSEIAAAVTLAKQLKGRRASILGFEEMMNLSPEARDAINQHADEFLNDQFRLDWNEFSQHLAYRSVELNNGGMLTAEAGAFDDVFKREDVRGRDGNVRFSTEGKIVSERLGKSKIERLGRKHD